MNTAILVVSNLVLFVGFLAASVFSTSWLTSKAIGFYFGGRFAVFTKEDAISRRKHNWLLTAVSIAYCAVSVVLFLTFGSEFWSAFVLAPTLASAIGIVFSLKSDRQRLLPYGCPRQR